MDQSHCKNHSTAAGRQYKLHLSLSPSASLIIHHMNFKTGCLTWQKPCPELVMWLHSGCFYNNIPLIIFNEMDALDSGNVDGLQKQIKGLFHLLITSLFSPSAVNHTVFLGSIDLICIKLLMQLFIMHGLPYMLGSLIMPMHLPLITVNNGCFLVCCSKFYEWALEWP